jgi:hypothetical protein
LSLFLLIVVVSSSLLLLLVGGWWLHQNGLLLQLGYCIDVQGNASGYD